MFHTLSIIPHLSEYNNHVVATIIALVIFVSLRITIHSLTKRFGKRAGFSEHRTTLITKYIDYFLTPLAIISIVTIWGAEGKQIFVIISSILTIIGVAFFAQWSILSNITAGIILFFSFPFKIGDRIRILDKDFPIDAKIEDIKSFYTLLKTTEGEEISYPNNLLLQKGIVIVS